MTKEVYNEAMLAWDSIRQNCKLTDSSLPRDQFECVIDFVWQSAFKIAADTITCVDEKTPCRLCAKHKKAIEDLAK